MSETQTRRTREEILARWDALPAEYRQMCAHALLQFGQHLHKLEGEAYGRQWYEAAIDIREGRVAVDVGIALLGFKVEGDKADP